MPPNNAERMGICFGTAIGGFEKGTEGVDSLRRGGPRQLSPFALPETLPNMCTYHITEAVGIAGYSSTITTACATGTQTIGEAMLAIQRGVADVMLAGGTEALVQEYTVAAFAAMRALPTSFNQAPEKASRPFEARREGFILSEGAACLVLESLAHAQARGARIYAEVVGYASYGDGYHVAAPDPSAASPIRTMSQALKSAGISLDDVDYINAHGTSTPANDAVETLAIKRLFGDRAYAIPISSTKSMLGHAMGAAGAIEAAVCALSIEQGQIHPTINYQEQDPECDLDYVANVAREAQVDVALSNSFGLGGQNACLVVRRFGD